MGRTAAAELARIKTTYPRWTIRSVEHGAGFTAQHKNTGKGGKPLSIHAFTVSELGAKLAELGERRGPKWGGRHD
jgi:hypothetical protein